MQEAISRYPKPVYFNCSETKRFWDTFNMRFRNASTLLGEGAEIVGAIADEEKSSNKAVG